MSPVFRALRVFGYISLGVFALTMALNRITWAWLGVFGAVFAAGTVCAFFPQILGAGMTRDAVQPFFKPFVMGALFVAAVAAMILF